MTSNLCARIVFLELVVILFLSSFLSVFFFPFFFFHHVLFLVINVLTNDLYYQNRVDAKVLCYNNLVDTENHVTQYKSCQPWLVAYHPGVKMCANWDKLWLWSMILVSFFPLNFVWLVMCSQNHGNTNNLFCFRCWNQLSPAFLMDAAYLRNQSQIL